MFVKVMSNIVARILVKAILLYHQPRLQSIHNMDFVSFGCWHLNHYHLSCKNLFQTTTLLKLIELINMIKIISLPTYRVDREVALIGQPRNCSFFSTDNSIAATSLFFVFGQVVVSYHGFLTMPNLNLASNRQEIQPTNGSDQYLARNFPRLFYLQRCTSHSLISSFTLECQILLSWDRVVAWHTCIILFLSHDVIQYLVPYGILSKLPNLSSSFNRQDSTHIWTQSIIPYLGKQSTHVIATVSILPLREALRLHSISTWTLWT